MMPTAPASVSASFLAMVSFTSMGSSLPLSRLERSKLRAVARGSNLLVPTTSASDSAIAGTVPRTATALPSSRDQEILPIGTTPPFNVP